MAQAEAENVTPFYGSPDWIGSVLSRGAGYGVSAESGFPVNQLSEQMPQNSGTMAKKGSDQL